MNVVIKIPSPASGCYLLKLQGVVVYVGMSKHVLYRIAGHRDKRFDEIEIIWCVPKKLAALERRLIRRHAPKLNAMPEFMRIAATMERKATLESIFKNSNHRTFDRSHRNINNK